MSNEDKAVKAVFDRIAACLVADDGQLKQIAVETSFDALMGAMNGDDHSAWMNVYICTLTDVLLKNDETPAFPDMHEGLTLALRAPVEVLTDLSIEYMVASMKAQTDDADVSVIYANLFLSAFCACRFNSLKANN